MPNPYRIAGELPSEDEEWPADPMRSRRRVGAALALVALAVLVGLLPLTIVFIVIPRLAAIIWLAVAVAQVVSGATSAHLLFGAREADRSRAQSLCAWVGGAAIVFALLGVIVTTAGTIFALFVESLGPWCGVCGT